MIFNHESYFNQTKKMFLILQNSGKTVGIKKSNLHNFEAIFNTIFKLLSIKKKWYDRKKYSFMFLFCRFFFKFSGAGDNIFQPCLNSAKKMYIFRLIFPDQF